MNEKNDDSIKHRKVYEINELLQSGEKKLIKLYLAIKNASEYAYARCSIQGIHRVQ